MVTPDLHLRVLKYLENNQLNEDAMDFKTLHDVSLVHDGMTSEGRYPVGLECGYIDAYNNIQSRKQIIVVLTENWGVLCFTSELELLWETTVSYMEDNLQLGKLYHKEIGINISPMSIIRNDHGTIFVGGSMELISEEKLPEGDHDGFFNVHDENEVENNGINNADKSDVRAYKYIYNNYDYIFK